MCRRPQRSPQGRSSAASDVYKRQGCTIQTMCRWSVYAAGSITDPQCKEVACAYEYELNCARNPDCLWNVTTNTCSIRTCMYGDYEPCILSLIHISEPTRPY
eukprot:TRINITY_DN29678_c0_g1_i1.p1 TRINITY_DN29678_c0_g1~~TRINITY_DN29678_c0_g1_i1.p1  ORF type:complete len:102 (-),score=30.89 TRINITY_DN29678_c0_g1_i1:65-370(-)